MRPGLHAYRQSPWLGPACEAEELPDGMLEHRRAEYLKGVIKTSKHALNQLSEDYHDFRQQLSFLNPHLSKKHFSFTLGPDQQIRVTDPDQVLTAAELGYLTERLNEREPLKAPLHTHARTVMELVDHLTEMFGDRYTVTLENFHKVIDFGQMFTRNTLGNVMNTWAWQVHQYADPREDAGSALPSQIDVTA
ncbi:hypothetical protein [Pseudomonas syringae]|nr:hypothetical protein [Pseudomonas syringae]